MYIGPEIVVPVAGLVTLTSIVLGSKWIGYKRMTGGAAPGSLDALEKRLARVEVALDDLTTEIGRVGEGQQFLTKVLADRVGSPALPPKQ